MQTNKQFIKKRQGLLTARRQTIDFDKQRAQFRRKKKQKGKWLKWGPPKVRSHFCFRAKTNNIALGPGKWELDSKKNERLQC